MEKNMRARVVEMPVEMAPTECEACAARRELRVLYLEALALHPGEPGYGETDAVLLRVRRVLRAKCTCTEQPFDLRAKCRELGCRPRGQGNVN